MIEAFADAMTALDDSMPNGTCIDMCSRLPLVDPKRILCPTPIMRGEYDGIAAFGDLIRLFSALPNGDKPFSVMAGISHGSFRQKNYRPAYSVPEEFFGRPETLHRGE